jgi:hypothetical protein
MVGDSVVSDYKVSLVTKIYRRCLPRTVDRIPVVVSSMSCMNPSECWAGDGTEPPISCGPAQAVYTLPSASR